MAVQCNKADEDMLLADNVDDTVYWKLFARKRYAAIVETERENGQVHEDMAALDKRNEATRAKIAALNKLLNEYEEIRVSALVFEFSMFLFKYMLNFSSFCFFYCCCCSK